MISKTKRTLSPLEVETMVKKAFGDKITIKDSSQLTDGYFNNSYKLSLSSNQDVVLKVAPDPRVDVLTYEKQLMCTEVEAMNIMDHKQLPVPRVLYYDHSLKVIDSEYFFMTYLNGTPLNKVKDKMSEDQVKSLTQSIGQTMSRLLTDPYTNFGEVGNINKQFDNWFDCFTDMISDLMDDANKINLKLALDKQAALDLLKQHQANLSQVETGVLVHKDLWDGNIFVDDNYQLVGIIDSERAIIGDPLMEIVCGHYHHNPSFIEAYMGKKDLDEAEKTRVLLYLVYINLLMIIECPYRQYPDDNQFNWASEQLDITLEQLKAISL